MSDQIQEINNSSQDSKPTMLGQPSWSGNPVVNGTSTTLSVPIEYDAEQVIAGEYIHNSDPGEGNGTPMEVKDNRLTTTILVNLPLGSHPINIRAKTASGTWSALEPTVLTIMTTPTSAEGSNKSA